jgi:hypothetical protein
MALLLWLLKQKIAPGVISLRNLKLLIWVCFRYVLGKCKILMIALLVTYKLELIDKIQSGFSRFFELFIRELKSG